MLKQIAARIVKQYLQKIRYKKNRRMFESFFRKIMKQNPDNINNPINNPAYDSWFAKWSVFGFAPTPLAWKAFAPYMNDNIDFVPNDVARSFIEPVLTPEAYQPFYNDKNSFGLFLDKSWMPKTYFRSMNGVLYDEDYGTVRPEDFLQLFDGVDRLVVKPAKDMGGKGVALFKRDGVSFKDSAGNILDLQYLKKTYKKDFLIQECLTQNDYMSQFNPSSINTIRVATYRDVKTGNIEFLGAVLRIGGKGSFVDNACSGGSFVYVNADGTLGKYACNEYGQTSSVYNDIDFANNEFVIPNFEEIKQFVYKVARRMPHMSLFANDVAIDHTGTPRLIEVNTIQFSYWLYQFNGKPVFGPYTDELIEYCLKENKNIRPSFFLKYD